MSNLLIGILIFAVWIILQVLVFPKMGVTT
jgi:hypothetical protein